MNKCCRTCRNYQHNVCEHLENAQTIDVDNLIGSLDDVMYDKLYKLLQGFSNNTFPENKINSIADSVMELISEKAEKEIAVFNVKNPNEFYCSLYNK